MATIAERQDPATTEVASQWKLMWWAFRRHRLAMIALGVVLLLYLLALFAEFLAPFNPHEANRRAIYHPPQAIQFIDTDEAGNWSFRPHVNAFKLERDPFTLQANYTPQEGEKIYLTFFGRGATYNLWGLFESDLHFLTTVDPQKRFYLFGADRLSMSRPKRSAPNK
ncbi:MAG: hypothetical protein AAFW60_09555 [Pseudomonadota bacterium]